MHVNDGGAADDGDCGGIGGGFVDAGYGADASRSLVPDAAKARGNAVADNRLATDRARPSCRHPYLADSCPRRTWDRRLNDRHSAVVAVAERAAHALATCLRQSRILTVLLWYLHPRCCT